MHINLVKEKDFQSLISKWKNLSCIINIIE